MGTIILNVVIVLGIIIAGGFLIFFLGDLLISIIDPKGEEERIKNKKKDSAKKAAEKIETLPEADKEELKEDPQVAAILAEIEETPEEAEEEVKAEPVVETYQVEEVEEAPEEEVKEPTEEEKLAEARAALERRKEEILKRMQAQLEEDEDEEEEEEEEAEEEVEEVVEEVPAENEEAAAIRAELEEAKRALEAERARNAALAAELNNVPTQTVEVAAPTKTREEYEAQIAILETRLRDNEKELKACKKEYLPLAKVNKTLANDEKKLRRKEAIVAKQKVMLYGVNNYEDIDEEKAKKLAEELDLLDGLKLSVQHCHEVMENNKDRFPVLEKMYFILKAQNEQIKADIAEAELAIKNLDEKED